MKNLLTILFVSLCSFAQAQSKQTRVLMSKTSKLEKAIFETKDIAVLSQLFANEVKYIGFDGSTKSRAEAISAIVNNKTTYGKAVMRDGYGVKKNTKDSAVVKYLYRGTEFKPDGTSSILTCNVVTGWHRENKEWKLYRLEMQKIN